MLIFTSVDKFLAKAFLIFVVCLFVRNNSCGNSSSSKFFLFNLNIVPVLLFAADFYLLDCAFVNFSLASWYFTIFYNPVTLPWENFNLISLICLKFVKTSIHCDLSVFMTSTFLSCPTNYIYWIALGSAFFCLLKSNAIIYNDFCYNHNLINI